MRTITTILMFCFSVATLFADTYPYLTFELADGTKMSVSATSLTFTINATTLTAGEQTFTLTDLSKMYFSMSNETTTASSAIMTITASAGYVTFVAPFDVTVPFGVRAYTVDGIASNGSEVELTEVGATIPAHTPVVLHATSDVCQTFYGTALSGTPTAGLLTGVYTSQIAPAGCYVLQSQQAGVKFYLVEASTGKDDTDVTIGAGHAYLTLPSAGVKVLGLNLPTATRIADHDISSSNVWHDFQKDEVFNIKGQSLHTPQHGLIIVNGKKVLIK